MIQNFKIHHSESGHFLSQTLLEGSAIHSEVIIKVCVFSLKRLICRIKPLLREGPSIYARGKSHSLQRPAYRFNSIPDTVLGEAREFSKRRKRKDVYLPIPSLVF